MSFARATRPLIVAAHVALLLAGCAEHHRHDRTSHHHRWPGDRPEAVERADVRASAQAEAKRVAKPKVKPAKTVAAKSDSPARVATPLKQSQPAPKMIAAPAPTATAPASKPATEKPVVLAPAPEKPAIADAKPVTPVQSAPAPALPKESGVALTRDNQAIVRPAEVDKPDEVARPAPVTRPALQPPEPRIVAQPKAELPKSPEASLPKIMPPVPPPKAPAVAQPAPTPPPEQPKAVQPPPAPIAPLPSDPPKAAAPSMPAPTATDRPPPAPKAPPAAASPKSPPEGVAALIERTNLLLRIGNVAEARRILEEPAKAKNADAIAELGRTYDPNELQPFLVPPGSADLAKAIELYTEAGRLGSAIARTRLEKLKATHSSPVPAKK
jgi:hypothetical protein